jgi:uncharacterized protein
MNIEWDESKRLANIQKHGIDFIDVMQIFDGYTISVEDQRFDYPEIRYNTIGMLKSLTVVVVVHTFEESDVVRIISARKATKYEQKRYFD